MKTYFLGPFWSEMLQCLLLFWCEGVSLMNLGELYLRYDHFITNYKFETLAVPTQVKPCHLQDII